MSDPMVRAEALAALAKLTALRPGWPILRLIDEATRATDWPLEELSDVQLHAGLRRYLSEVEKETGK